MKIGYLGMGAWGYCLASLLATKAHHELICWTPKQELALHLEKTREHPLLSGHKSKGKMSFTTDISKAILDVDFIVESVTSAGLRPVLKKMREYNFSSCPLVITSKGIEQESGKILPEVALDVLGDDYRPYIGVLSGPSFAAEVIKGLPTSVVGSAYDTETMQFICEAFNTSNFRIYPNIDILGVSLGGALKNITAIACGIAEGLALGWSAKAALMTRGLHEIRKLAVAHGAKPETLNGLSGMGDLCVTCGSLISRNFRFGLLLAQGLTSEEAQKKIGMVVEGAYTCISALQLNEKYRVSMPIAETVYEIIEKRRKPIEAVTALMQRPVKEEHL